MATKLREFDFGPQSKLTVRKKTDYPWDDWFDGDIWQITMGEDFEGTPLMMERIIRSRAVPFNAKVTLRHRAPDDGPGMGVIIFQRTDIEGPTARKRREASEKRAATKAAKATNGTVSKKAPRRLTAVG